MKMFLAMFDSILCDIIIIQYETNLRTYIGHVSSFLSIVGASNHDIITLQVLQY